jgi:hypothetical protein
MYYHSMRLVGVRTVSEPGIEIKEQQPSAVLWMGGGEFGLHLSSNSKHPYL